MQFVATLAGRSGLAVPAQRPAAVGASLSAIGCAEIVTVGGTSARPGAPAVLELGLSGPAPGAKYAF